MKKLISLVLCVMLASSALLGIAFVTPVKAMFVPEIFISPSKNIFYPPCIVSTDFDISVKLFNEKEETGYGVYAFSFELYWMNSTELFAPAYPNPGLGQGDLKQAMIDLVSYEIKSPWPEGKYFIIQDELNTTVKEKSTHTLYDPINDWTGDLETYWNYYKFAITALDTAPPLDEIKAPIVDFTFHIADEPLYPAYWYTPFTFENVHMTYLAGAAKTPTEIPNVIAEDGYYLADASDIDGDGYPATGPVGPYGSLGPIWGSGYANAPQMWLEGPKPWDENVPKDGYPDYWYVVCWSNTQTFTVEVETANLGKAFSFGFDLYFNASIITTDLQHIHIKDMFPPPYETLEQEITIADNPWTTLSHLHFYLARPCNKPPICGSGPVVNIEFKAICPTEPIKGLPSYQLPYTIKGQKIELRNGEVDSKFLTPSTYPYVNTWTYGFGAALARTNYYLIGAPPAIFAYYGWPYGTLDQAKAGQTIPFVEYNWIPNKADLDQSGHVDITDLTAIAKQYGKDLTDNVYATQFTKIMDLKNVPVDLLDVVYVAKYFCKDITPKDPHTGLLYVS